MPSWVRCDHFSAMELLARLHSPMLLRAALTVPQGSIVIALRLPANLLIQEGIILQDLCPEPGLLGFATFEIKQLAISLSRLCFRKNLSPFDTGDDEEESSSQPSHKRAVPSALLRLVDIGDLDRHEEDVSLRPPRLLRHCHENDEKVNTAASLHGGVLRIQEAINSFWLCVRRDRERLSQRMIQSVGRVQTHPRHQTPVRLYDN